MACQAAMSLKGFVFSVLMLALHSGDASCAANVAKSLERAGRIPGVIHIRFRIYDLARLLIAGLSSSLTTGCQRAIARMSSARARAEVFRRHRVPSLEGSMKRGGFGVPEQVGNLADGERGLVEVAAGRRFANLLQQFLIRHAVLGQPSMQGALRHAELARDRGHASCARGDE